MAITNITDAIEALQKLSTQIESLIVVDKTLSMEWYAADAKAVGDALSDLNQALTALNDKLANFDANHNDAILSLAEDIRDHSDNKSNPHQVTVEQIGAAPADHTHTASGVGAAASDHTHTLASLGAASAGHTHTAEEIGAATRNHSHNALDVGAASSNHTHTPDSIGASPSNHTHTASSIGAAPSSHTQSASTISSGTFGGRMIASAYLQEPGTSLIRNSKIAISATIPSNNGEINWVYG